MRQILAVALEAGQLRRLGVFAQALFLDLGVVALAQSAQPPPPAFGIAADHRGLDDQALPLPRRAETAFDDRRLVVEVRLRSSFRVGSVRCGLEVCESCDHIVGRRQDLGRCRRFASGHLRERQVLGKADRRQALDRAAEDREEGAPRRVRPPRAAIEPGVDAGALERVFNEAQVFARRAQEDGHLVEPDAALRLVENPPGDFHALAPFTGRREEPDVAARHALRRLARGKK